MSDAFPLLPHPGVEQYEKFAIDFQRACHSNDDGAIRSVADRWAEKIAGSGAEAKQIEQRWDEFEKTSKRAAPCALADVQFFVAEVHGFSSWQKFVEHLGALEHPDSAVSMFEAAADAIVSGDSPTLANLLMENAELVRIRSNRKHRSALLHYVSANGVENFRQKTPGNIVEITKLLLDAGSDVNAESDAYGGRSTTLGLTATSWHPEKAGVQIPLLELLIGHGAVIDGPDGGSAVNSCLHNGRGQAAEFLAGRGARLDLEGAAGVGRLEIVRGFFSNDGSLQLGATREQMKDGFAWACEFGRTQVVEFLLDRGMDVGEQPLRHHGQSGLHWAAFCGNVDTVELLLRRHAPLEVKDKTFGSTPLGWALYAWTDQPEVTPSARFHQVADLLVQAGAKVEPEWLDDSKVRADPEMLRALTGRPT